MAKTKRTPLERALEELATAKAARDRHRASQTAMQAKVERLQKRVDWLQQDPDNAPAESEPPAEADGGTQAELAAQVEQVPR